MALPTTGLKLHCRADRTNQLFKTYSGTGTHTGTPVDGDAVEVWDDEGDGVTDVCLLWNTSATEAPNYRSSSPLMKNSCLDFDGSNDVLSSVTQTGGAVKAISTLIANNAFTMMAAFWPEAIASTASNVYDRECLMGDNGQFVGLFLGDAAGTKTLYGYNFDGSVDSLSLPIATGRTWIVVFRHSGGNLKLSVIDDAGTETSASDVASGNTSDITNRLAVGRAALSARYNGRIGEFAIWNTDLSTGSDLTDAKDYFKTQWLTLAGGGGKPWLYYARQMSA
jgi:hypothetical protein